MSGAEAEWSKCYPQKGKHYGRNSFLAVSLPLLDSSLRKIICLSKKSCLLQNVMTQNLSLHIQNMVESYQDLMTSFIIQESYAKELLCIGSCCFVAESCLTFCHPRDCSSPGSSVHGDFQARILEWFAISISNVLVTGLRISF